MSFLNPLGLLFLGLVPLLVLLYLRRIRRERAVVSTLLFWQRAAGEQRQRFWLGKLRNWFSLLLFLLILLLLTFALARLEFGIFGGKASYTVLVVDTRARMQAREADGETRFAKALRQADAFAQRAYDGAQMAILATRPTPEVISPFSDDASALRRQLATLTVTDAAIDPAPTLELAQQLASSRKGQGRVVFITDALGRSEVPSVEVIAVGSGEPLDNVAITRFAARPQIASPSTADLLLEVANFGRTQARGSVEIRCDGAVLDVRPFDLAPGARAANVFQALPRAGSGLLEAHLRIAGSGSKDALPLDDTAYATLPPSEPLHVLLVTRGNWFLEKLLAADETLRFDLLEPDAFRPEMAAQFDAVIYDDCGPASLEELPALLGNALFIGSSPLGKSGTLAQPSVTDSDAASPLLRHVSWEEVTLLRADKVGLPQGADSGAWKFDAPVRSFDDPLIVTGVRRGGEGSEVSASNSQRLAVFAFDLGASDLPLRVAFPLLMSNTLRWLAKPDDRFSGDLLAGGSVRLGYGESARRVGEVGASGQGGEAVAASRSGDAPVSSLETQESLFQPLRNGFYELTQKSSDALAAAGAGGEAGQLGGPRVSGSDDAGKTRWLAVNTFSDAEANLAPLPSSASTAGGALAPGSGATVLPPFISFLALPLWQWLAVVAFVLFLLEWWLFNRRQTE